MFCFECLFFSLTNTAFSDSDCTFSGSFLKQNSNNKCYVTSSLLTLTPCRYSSCRCLKKREKKYQMDWISLF